MGMFDSFYDADGNEWQTKALACNLDNYRIGDPVPCPPLDHQMKVLGGPHGRADFAYATIRGGRLASVPDERDRSLSLLDYHGGWLALSAPESGEPNE